MAGIMVSASMGVMKPLLTKLVTLMGDKYKKLKGVQKEVLFLKDELGTMNALLEKMDDIDELDPLAKNWRKHVVDMAYDIEDCIDDFMHRVCEAEGKVGILQKASHCLKTFKDHYLIANEIQKIKIRVIEASERRWRYKLYDFISNTTLVAVDPRILALYKETASLVGIDTPKKEVIKLLRDEGQQLIVVPIIGFGGLGKTTLANEVYREIGGQFNCKAFVAASQKPNITTLLNSLLSQFNLNPPSHAHEAQDLINMLRAYLQDKRYFIVVDDLWDKRAWNVIKCAFPQNNQRSRIIITSRVEDVARACCSDHGCIHNMKPLIEILRKCGGLPLAIITVAGILACHPTRLMEQWEHIQDCLASQYAENPSLEDMMHILDLSYKNLPRHLKACFLYLGSYPEDHTICRDELVRRWVAEGFVTVSASHRGDEWDVAMSYFNELVNRSMIQPVYDCYNVEVVSCRLHDMMLDLIVRRCREYNFVSLVHDPGAVVELQDKVRRLTANLNGAEMPVIISNCSHLSQIRSLAILERSYWAPPLLEFKRLRVLLLLEFPKNIKRIDLTCISQLSQLRYLKVQTHHIVLPSQIRNMRKLETLEIPFEVFSSIPSDIVDLPCLANLIMPWDLLLPDGIGKLTSLRTLKSFRVWMSSSETIEGIGKLTNLTDLSLERCRKLVGPTGRCADDHTTTATWMTALTSSLEKLVRLKRLSLESFPAGCCACSDGLSSLTPNIGNLEWLDVSEWTFYRVPRWIGDLHNLRSLRLTVKEMSKSSWEDDSIIGKLPSLILLNLKITGVLTERIVIGGSTGFALLRRFEFNYDGTSHLRFESGAMPKLRELMLRLDPWAWDKATPVGLHHLSSLMEINVHTLELRDSTTGGSGESGQKIMNSVFSKAAAAIPSRPAVAVWCG
ncbi:hypothetical protein HU200_028353 [Digitaria exilis]|uniref:Uncharacterized protein n=1 Tax=Digitaria exilis TaxID=1010633 RepID=A0A835BRI0_9POAL|nr:hypothetical protein HU200_028353 [Digitaria exilis]